MWAKFLNLWKSLFGSRELQTCLIGLQNSGKTTLTNALANDPDHDNTIPTIGFNVRQVKKGRVQLSLWDLGGYEKFRNLWERYCNDANCIVFIIDASAREYFSEAKSELLKLLELEVLERKPLLVLGNKRDIEGSATEEEIAQLMDLASIQDRDVACYSISAKNKENLDVVVKWLMHYSK